MKTYRKEMIKAITKEKLNNRAPPAEQKPEMNFKGGKPERISKMDKMIYSNSLDCMVISGFAWDKHHYTWNDEYCLFYRDDVDDDYFMTVPDDAIIDKE